MHYRQNYINQVKLTDCELRNEKTKAKKRNEKLKLSEKISSKVYKNLEDFSN